MHFLPELLEAYIENHSQPEPQILTELTRETHIKVVQPRMISGHLQGRILSMLSKLISPKQVLEIGTYTGYSAICLAEGLAAGGQIHTIDINEELAPIQNKYFEKSSFRDRITQYVGDALEIIPTMDVCFDLVFIDAEKASYPAYLEVILPKVKVGSVILSDNVLWSGKVIEPLQKGDKATKALLEYNRTTTNHPRLETVILPLRDGLTISRVVK
ncbi:MAG: O-methyltransferase [Flavobacteriaceae bacterium]|nr:O-methyltransferase [Flavobacteriaceae bacterium]